MPITSSETEASLARSGFLQSASTQKLTEYQSKKTGRTLYVYKNQGYPDHADVVIHPESDIATLLTISGIQPNKRVKYRFGSNMGSFPKQLNRGKQAEHYGRALYVFSSIALCELCKAYEL